MRRLIAALRILTREGMAGLYRRMRRRWRYTRSLDRRFGVDTEGYIPLDQLTGIESLNVADGVQYQPTPQRLLEKTLAALDIDHRQFTFIDFGSGKGRALLIASRLPFNRIIGIEFSPELHEIAVRNVAKYPVSARKCARIEPICADATLFSLPDEPSIFYFFNPFGPSVLAPVLDNIVRSLERHPRRSLFIYVNPRHPEVFAAAGIRGSALLLVPVTDADLERG